LHAACAFSSLFSLFFKAVKPLPPLLRTGLALLPANYKECAFTSDLMKTHVVRNATMHNGYRLDSLLITMDVYEVVLQIPWRPRFTTGMELDSRSSLLVLWLGMLVEFYVEIAYFYLKMDRIFRRKMYHYLVGGF
jgi:hypothetical protein